MTDYNEIFFSVAKKHHLTVEQMLRKDRDARLVRARQEAMHAFNAAGYTTGQIARFFNIHHSSVTHGIYRHSELLKGPQASKKKMPCHKDVDHEAMRYARKKGDVFRKIDLKTGSMSELLYTRLSEECLDKCVDEAIKERYETMAEYFADQITDVVMNYVNSK